MSMLTRRHVLKAVVALCATTSVNYVLALPNKPKEPEKYTMSVSVIITFVAKKEKIDEFNTIMNSVKTDLPKVNGCRAVAVFRSSTDESKFTLVETWESKELHQDHLDKLTTDGTWDMIASQLSNEPESDYFFEI